MYIVHAVGYDSDVDATPTTRTQYDLLVDFGDAADGRLTTPLRYRTEPTTLPRRGQEVVVGDGVALRAVARVDSIAGDVVRLTLLDYLP